MKSIKTFGLLAFTIIVYLTSCGKSSKNDPIPQNKEKVLHQYDFSTSNSAWGTGENSYSKRSLSNGYYKVYNKSDSDFYFSYTNVMFNGLSDKIAMEAKMNISGGNSSWPAFGGLTWNYKIGGLQINVFGYYNNGTYEIFGYDDNNSFIEIQPITASAAIKKNADNVLRIEQRSDNKFHFLINGTEVYSTDINDYNLDVSGIYADPKTTTAVDYYKAIQLP